MKVLDVSAAFRSTFSCQCRSFSLIEVGRATICGGASSKAMAYRWGFPDSTEKVGRVRTVACQSPTLWK